MKPPRQTLTHEQRLSAANGANMAMAYSLAAIVTSLAVAHYARGPLTFKDHLSQAMLLTVPFIMGGTWLWSRKINRRQRTAKVVTAAPTDQERQGTQSFLFWATAHSILLCLVSGYLALDMLFHSSLGWGHKTGLVAAVNGLAFVLMRFVPVVAWHIKRGTWDRPIATDVPAPVAAPVAVGFTVTIKPAEAAPLVVGRKP